jgi:hypothetical protein
VRRRVDISIEMHRRQDIGDAAIEAFFSGNGAGDELPSSLAAIADELRGLASGPVPEPTPQLAALLANGFSTEKGDLPVTAASNVPGPAPQAAGLPKWRSGRMTFARFLAGLSVAAKATLGAGVAMASVTAVGAAGALPGPLQNVVATTVEAVTPFDLPGSGSDDAGDDARDRTRFGERVSTDAKDGGVDGKVVSEDAKQNGETNRADAAGDAGRPDDPGSAGLDRGPASPATDRGPTSVPSVRPEGVGRTGSTSTVPDGETGEADATVVDGPVTDVVPDVDPSAVPGAPGGDGDVPAVVAPVVPTDRSGVRK